MIAVPSLRVSAKGTIPPKTHEDEKDMLTLTFHNDGTGTVEVGNYDVVVIVNRQVVAKERVEGHKRAEGWRGLVLDLATRICDGMVGPCGCEDRL